MYWLTLTLLAIVARAFYGISTKVLSSTIHVSAMTQGVLLTSGAAILSLAICPFIGGLSLAHVADQWPLILIMIVAQSIGNVLFFKGQSDLEASVTQIAFSSILLWSVLLSALFLGSRFSLKQAIGIAILFVAIMLIQYRKKGLQKLSPAALYIIASAAAFAVFQVASAGLAKYLTTGTYLVFAYAGSALVIGGVYLNKVMHDLKCLEISKQQATFATIFASGMSMLYFMLSYFAYKQAPDRGVVVVLLTSQVVLSVILGILLLKERQDTSKKLTAGALAVLAGVLIKS